MKTFHLVFFLFLFSTVYAQELSEKAIETKVKEVTVFIEGAQITREKAVDVPQGISLLKFVNLSPFIDAKSVQVKADGDVTVLSVNHQQNYLDQLEKPKKVKDIEDKIESAKKQLQLEETYLAINNEELEFLRQNRSVGGRVNAMSVTNLKEVASFYDTKLTELKLKEIDLNKKIDDLTKQKKQLDDQLSTLTSKKEFPNGEIVVKVEAKAKTTADFELSYLVKNAGWFPSYDIRAKSINDPVEIIYKANLRQDTKVDWSNIKLKLSSSNPNTSGVAPELQTYYLGYNTRPPAYRQAISSVTGQVFDNENKPLAGATVMVQGATIGTVTDMGGNYSITLPPGTNQLTYSFIGFEQQTLPVNSPVMNVFMVSNQSALDEVVAVGYGVQKKANLTGAVQLKGVVSGVNVSKTKSREAESIAVPFQKTENQTTVDFEIKTPYSVKSDNKNYSVDMEVYNLPASYQYFCIPKIDKDAFLLANITDWEKYNLLEGEANIFFEDTYIGKTLLDVRFASDTLQISLGRDKNVSVNRENVKDHTTRQFIGTKKEETRAWKIMVKNNKSQPVNMVIADQVPVSKLEEIEVEVKQISGAKLDKETGEVKWIFELRPSDKKEFELMYSVKYPKSKNLVLE